MNNPDEIEKTEGRSSQSEQTDRVNGEYHYKNGYTQRIYSDAHYVRAGDSTTPPRYYTPPERPRKEPAAGAERRRSRLGAVVALCLVCALLGGLAGGAWAGRRYNALAAELSELREQGAQPQRSSVSAVPMPTAVSDAEALSAPQIYELACQQVVGVTSEFSYTNYFGMRSSAAVSGTGFVISEDGYILTNYHVIEKAWQAGVDVHVIFRDGTRYTAQVVGAESDNDLALLHIEAEGLTPAVFGDSDALQVGETVYAVGNPLGELDFSMSTGTVSAKDRSLTTDQSSVPITMFQIDAAVNSGNSGGPVYNSRGEVVGIVTAKSRASGTEGLGFAIPANDAARIARELTANGYVSGKAQLGIIVNTGYNAMIARFYGWPAGVYVDSVNPGSCAEAAGILADDILTAFNGSALSDRDSLRAALRRCSPGDTVELEVFRAGETLALSVTLDEEAP